MSLGSPPTITTERVVVDAADPNREVMRFNPLGRIPTLILDDGGALHDFPGHHRISRTRASTAPLMPASGRERWDALTLQALADGVMEADLRLLEERKHLGGGKRDAHVAGMRAKIAAALDCVEQTPPTGITVGEVALGSALAHLDFRFPDEPWRAGPPAPRRVVPPFSARPSMRATPFAINIEVSSCLPPRSSRLASGQVEVYSGGAGPLVVLLPSLGRGAADFMELGDRLIKRGYRVRRPSRAASAGARDRSTASAARSRWPMSPL